MLILHNGRIYRNGRDKHPASAVAISDGKIIWVGDEMFPRKNFDKKADYFDLEGSVVLPGFTDAHIHLASYGFSLQKIDCETQTKNECLQRIKEKTNDVPDGEWILGHGWNQNIWKEGMGDINELDSLTSKHPIFLTAKSLHAAWVNTAALTLAGVDQNTSDPRRGHFGRDNEGRLNGILFEDAMDLVANYIPKPSIAKVMDAIRMGQTKLLSYGITGVHDFDDQRCTIALQELKKQGMLFLRVLKSIPFANMKDAINLGLESGFGDDFLRFGNIKLFADGALGPRTAAMFEPYNDQPDNKGMLFLDKDALITIGERAELNGLKLAVHAIGDRANHEVLNAFEFMNSTRNNLRETKTGESKTREEIPNGLGSRDQAPRWRIEHAQLLTEDDIQRFGKLKIIASMQPLHAVSDIEAAEKGWGERSRTSYAWASLLNSSTVLAFGSDAPVESPNPFWGIWAAITRKKLNEGKGTVGWYPKQQIGIGEAINAYTKGSAYAAGMENKLGEIKEGYYADLMILDDDIFHCENEKLKEMAPRRVMIHGHWVYSK